MFGSCPWCLQYLCKCGQFRNLALALPLVRTQFFLVEIPKILPVNLFVHQDFIFIQLLELPLTFPMISSWGIQLLPSPTLEFHSTDPLVQLILLPFLPLTPLLSLLLLLISLQFIHWPLQLELSLLPLPYLIVVLLLPTS